MNISWTACHASIVGNEIADAFAKEAAIEARINLTAAVPPPYRRLRRPTRNTSCQNGNPEYGRAYQMLVPKVDTKNCLNIPNGKSFCQILQIQREYSKLIINDYRNKLGQCDSIECSCGESKTPEHFLIDCANYQHCRETLQLKLSSQL